MRWLLLILLVACEKSGPVESGGGTSLTPRESEVATPRQPAKVATLPSDAGVAPAPTDAAVAKVAPDAARRTVDDDIAANARVLADLMTSGSDDRITGDMSARRPGADLGKQIDDVREKGKSVAVGRGGGRGGGPRIGPGGGTTADDGATGGAVDSGPKGRISVSKKQAFDDTTLSADTVLAKIQSAYFAGLKRCYKDYLKKDPTSRGKVALTLTVNATGRAISVRAKGFALEIDDCITAMMASWRFPVPKDKDGEATEASFEIHLLLVSD